jgi:hypothetical protein
VTARRRASPAIASHISHQTARWTPRAGAILTGALTCALLGAPVPRACADEARSSSETAQTAGAGDGDGDEAATRPRKITTEAARAQELELEMSLEFASAYVFRGYNVFQAESQREQEWVQRPLVVWTAPGTGLSLGYAGAYQMTGDNLVSNVAVGLGAEQDLFASYELGRGEPFGVTGELVGVAYPAAEKRDAGTSTPFFVDASIEPRYRRRLFLYLGYLRGFRHGPLDRDQLYVSPRVEKRFDIGDRFELALQVGAGVKILDRHPSRVQDNMFDVLATAALYCALTDVMYIGVKAGWAWTNLTASRDPDTGQVVRPRFADEYVPFLALVVGVEFSAIEPRHHAPPL